MDSFAQISQAVFRDYIRSAVIIDDEWPEHEILISDDEVDESNSIAEETEDDYIDGVEAALSSEATVPPEAPSAEGLDARILGRLRHALLRQGVLTCGLRYQRKDRKTAIDLARRADIVVLDWHLVRDDGAEALEILKELQGDALRFVCIWTGHGRAEVVKEMLIRGLGPPLAEHGRADLQFPNLVIAIRIKEDMEDDPELAVSPDRLLEFAIAGLANSFGGLVQLAVLEMTHRHREHLPRILEHVGRTIDTAVLLEAGDEDSPVGPGGAFLGVLVDEWRSRLEQDHESLNVLSHKGRQAFGAELGKALNNISTEDLKQHLISADIPEEIAAVFSKKASPEIKHWLEEGCEGSLPVVAGISFKKGDRTKNAAWGVLSSMTRRETPLETDHPSRADILEPLLRLDTLFHQQFEPPGALTQGTIVRVRSSERSDYLICTTPLCDAGRPKKVGGLYSFVRTRLVSTENVLKGVGAQWYCVVKHSGEYLCLDVLVKERVSLEVWNPNFSDSHVVHARFSLGGNREKESSREGEIELHPVAQLRLDHALALSSASATDAARVGVNRVELIRSRIRRGSS